MKNLHRGSNLSLLILAVIGFTNAFSPKPLVLQPSIQRISPQLTRRNRNGIQQPQPKRSFKITSIPRHQQDDISRNNYKPSSWWKMRRISWLNRDGEKKRSLRFSGRIYPVLSALVVLLFFPLRAMASDTALMSPIRASLEFKLTLRLIVAAFLGAGLGKERSIAKHSAGVRTMALVAMGASTFTVCSLYGFNIFGAKHDPGRMASQVASGVGFVGAGVITSTSHMNGRNIVHGLTTAATIWLSAGVGVACGTGLYQVATAAAALTIFILRLGRVRPLPESHPGTNANPRRRFIPAELSATPLNWQHTEDDDSFAETHDTAEWDEHHHTVQRILDDEMPQIIQEARRKIEAENRRLSMKRREAAEAEKHRLSLKREAATADVASKLEHRHHTEPRKTDRIVVVKEDPEIAEIMHHAWKNHTNHQEIHIKNMQRFSEMANKTVTTPL